MKTVGFLMLMVVSFSHDPGEGRLDEFLKKLDQFYERISPTPERSSMPNFGPGSTDVMPELKMRFRDEETGFEYSPHKGKIYSPDLKIGLDVNTGIVYDFKEGKGYRLGELKRKKKQAQS